MKIVINKNNDVFAYFNGSYNLISTRNRTKKDAIYQSKCASETFKQGRLYIQTQKFEELASDLDEFAYDYDTYDYLDDYEDREEGFNEIFANIKAFKVEGYIDFLKEVLSELAPDEDDFTNDIAKRAKELISRLMNLRKEAFCV